MQPDPKAYVHFKDRLAAQMYLFGINWRTPCSGMSTEDSIAWEEQCYRFTKPQRMTGLWRNDFEGVTFCPAPAQRCPNAASYDDRHPLFYGNFEIRSLPPGWTDSPPGGLYSVEFIGRRSKYGLAGGTKGADNVVIVDRWISVREIEPPPKN